jgi:hypothetical protein
MAAKRRGGGSRKRSGGKKHFIQSAIKRPGAFSAKARSAGMSTMAYANKVMANPGNYDKRTRQQANLARTLIKMGKKRKK